MDNIGIYILLFLVVFLSHGILLVNRGLYWDGWFLERWRSKEAWVAYKTFFRDVGMPLFYYVHRVFNITQNPIRFQKITTFFMLWLACIILFALLDNFSNLPTHTCIIISALFISIPIIDMISEFAVSAQYLITQVTYYTAIYLMCHLSCNMLSFYAEIGAHLMLYVLLIFSFNMNSLLVYHYPAILISIFNHNLFDHNILTAILQHSDVILLPPLFYYIKLKFTPTRGIYKKYNNVNISFTIIKKGIDAFLRDLCIPLTTSLFKVSILISPITITAVFFFKSHIPSEWLIVISTRENLILLVYGIILLCSALFPYLVVVQNLGYTGWETKNNLLCPLPLAILLCSLIQFIPFPLICFALLLTLILSFIIISQKKHLQLLALWAKSEFYLNYFKNNQWLNQYSLIGLLDQTKYKYRHRADETDFHPTALTSMLTIVDYPSKHIAYQRYSDKISELPQHAINEMHNGLPFKLESFSNKGKQCILQVNQKNSLALYLLCFRFLMARYRSIDNANIFLETQFDIKAHKDL